MRSLFREHVVRNRELSDLEFILILILNYFQTIIVEWFVTRLFRLLYTVGFNILPHPIILKTINAEAVTQKVQYIQTYVFYFPITKICKHLGSHNALKHRQLLDLFSQGAWRWPNKGRNMSPWQYTIFIVCNWSVVLLTDVFYLYNTSGWKTSNKHFGCINSFSWSFWDYRLFMVVECGGIREEGFDTFWDSCPDVLLDTDKLSAYAMRSGTAVEPGTCRKTFKRVVTITAYRRCLDLLNEMSYGAAEQIRELCVFRTGHDVHFVVVHHSSFHPYSHCLICPLGQSIAN